MNKTYIQKSTSPKLNLFNAFGITTKSIPDRQLEVKEMFKRDWVDQQGDEEYVPAIPVFKAYEQDLEFVYKGVLRTASEAIRTFLTYLQGAEFSLYDEYSQRGIRCRYVSYDNKAHYRLGEEAVVFTVKVKINNPLCYVLSTASDTITTTFDVPAIVFWDDGTNATYAADIPISKTFADPDHFAIFVLNTIVKQPTNMGDVITTDDGEYITY